MQLYLKEGQGSIGMAIQLLPMLREPRCKAHGAYEVLHVAGVLVC